MLVNCEADDFWTMTEGTCNIPVNTICLNQRSIIISDSHSRNNICQDYDDAKFQFLLLLLQKLNEKIAEEIDEVEIRLHRLQSELREFVTFCL